MISRPVYRRGLAAALAAFALVLFPLSHPAQAADSKASLTPAQQAAVDQLIHDYLLQHPDVLADAIQKAAAVAQAEQDSATRVALKQYAKDLTEDPEAPVLGNPHGDVTLVEFFDYQCPYCKQTVAVIDKLIAADPGLRVVMKEYPVLGDVSDFAARMSLAAARQGRFAEFHAALFALSGRLSDERILQTAKTIGLDTDRLQRDAQDARIDAALDANLGLGKAIGADGTPSFVAGDMMISSALSLDDLKQLVASARKKG